jgi:hypothetical protein
MPVRLPFAFDTSGVVVAIARGFLAVLAVVVLPGMAYSLLVSHQMAVVASLAIIGAIIVFLGRLILANMRAWKGTITSGEVIVEPVRLAGLRLGGPSGRFSLARFQGVRIEAKLTPAQIAVSDGEPGISDDGFEELYDLEADPYELENKASDAAYASVLAALRKTYETLKFCAGKSCLVSP